MQSSSSHHVTPLLIDILLVLHLLDKKLGTSDALLGLDCYHMCWCSVHHRSRNEMREHKTVALPGMHLNGGII